MTMRTAFHRRRIDKSDRVPETASRATMPDLGKRIDALLTARLNSPIPPDIEALYQKKPASAQGKSRSSSFSSARRSASASARWISAFCPTRYSSGCCCSG
jgi:hypothetical protein